MAATGGSCAQSRNCGLPFDKEVTAQKAAVFRIAKRATYTLNGQFKCASIASEGQFDGPVVK
jgi:hypothetical protein